MVVRCSRTAATTDRFSPGCHGSAPPLLLSGFRSDLSRTLGARLRAVRLSEEALYSIDSVRPASLRIYLDKVAQNLPDFI